jgi:hypothetical protein
MRSEDVQALRVILGKRGPFVVEVIALLDAAEVGANLIAEHDAALRIAYEITPETQTIAEAVQALVDIIRREREARR